MRPTSMRGALLLLPIALALPQSGCGSSSSPAGPSARTCAIAPPDASDWRLSADGTVFRDALGRAVLLRGVDAGGRSKFAPFAPFDFDPQNGPDYTSALASYMDRAASWGIDAMRVPFTWAAVEPNEGADDEAFLKRYDQLLDAAWARGIRTVVDFHQDIYAEVFCGDGFPAWTVPDPKPAPHHDCAQWQLGYLNDPNVRAAFDRLWAQGSSVQAKLVAMWDRMIARHKDRAGVIGFEVINEPGWGTQDVQPFEAGTLTQFYSAMVPHFRTAAPRSLVFVDPTGYAAGVAQTGLGKPAGDGIVFAPHYYPLRANPDLVQDDLAKWLAVGQSWNAPVFLGEFGAKQDDANAPSWMTAHWDALDALVLSGTEWEYSVSSESWNLEAYGLVRADGTELPVTSALIRPYARAIAGTSVATKFDASSRTFTLSYAPGSGATNVSEVALPARAYANGYAINLRGACVDATHADKLLLQADQGATRVELTITSK